MISQNALNIKQKQSFLELVRVPLSPQQNLPYKQLQIFPVFSYSYHFEVLTIILKVSLQTNR